MGFALIFVGILLAVSAVQGTTKQLGALVVSDFTGPGNFIFWLAAVLIIGGIGYVPVFRSLSRALLVLVIISLVLTKGNPNLPQGGFFQQLLDGIQGTATTTVNPSNPIFSQGFGDSTATLGFPQFAKLPTIQ